MGATMCIVFLETGEIIWSLMKKASVDFLLGLPFLYWILFQSFSRMEFRKVKIRIKYENCELILT